MRGAPWVLLSCLCCCLLGNNASATSPSLSSQGYTTQGGNTLPLSSVSSRPPATSEALNGISFRGSLPRSTGDASPSATGSLTPVISVTTASKGPSTAPPFSTSSRDTPPSPRDYQARSVETTRESQTSSLAGVSTSVPPSSPGGNALTETASQEASSPPQATTSPPSNVSGTPSVTPAVVTRTNSAPDPPLYSTPPLQGKSLLTTGSVTPVTAGVSVTAASGQSRAPLSSNFPQRQQSQSMEATQECPVCTCTSVTMTARSSSPGGNSLAVTLSREPSSSSGASALSSVSSSTPAVTSAVVTTTASADSAPGNTRDTLLPEPTSLVAITSGLSITAAPAGLSTTVSSGTSAQDTASFPPSPQTPSRGVSVEAHAVKPSGTTPTSSSPAAGTGSPGSALPDPSTSTRSFSSTPFTDSQTAQSLAELSAATSRDSTQETTVKSVFVHSTSSPTMSDVSNTGRATDLTDLSTPTSLISSSQETSAISKMAQTQSTGTTRGSETTSLVSLVMDTISTATVPPTSTPSGHMSLLTDAHILPPSDTTKTFLPTPVSGSHGTQTRAPTLSPLRTDGPRVVSPTAHSDVASHSPSLGWSASGDVLTLSSSSVVHENQTAGVSHSEGSDKTVPNTTLSSLGISTTPTHEYPKTVQTTPSTTNPRTSSVYMGPTNSHGGPVGSTLALSFSPTNYSSSKSTLGTSSPSKHPTLQPSTDVSSSGSASAAKVDTDQTTPSFHTSISNSSFSQPSLAPAGSSMWSTATRLAAHTSPLSVTSPSSPSTPSSGSPEKAETSGVTTTPQSTVASPLPTVPRTLPTSTASTLMGLYSTPSSGPVKPEPGVSLFPYGTSEGDQRFVERTVDFTSQLFRIKIGFPLGSSLWDSFYFTDNGQIFFPESDNHILAYPNPPPGGFTGQHTVATVAPFWDNADFSSHGGTIFYQEYETLYNEYNRLVRQVETMIKKFTSSQNYRAKWTLKVTWVNVSAYPALQASGTNTYQAILSTDGSRSYALFLYQSTGMQWDVALHSGNPVLMGFSSGDGYFENSPLMSRSLWEKYRPDQFLDPKLGVRGLQIYRLHREEKPNFRLRCLQRLSSLRPSWTRRPIFCPCSWQQGRWDLRFQPIRTGRRGPHGQHLCSFSSWRGGVCCSYGPWGEFREGWSVQSPKLLELLDRELETQNWCCRWNDKPSFCALYHARRPRVGCAAYRPPRPAWMFGDPHIFTLDGANFTFNGLGDFLLVQAQDGSSSFLLQGRTAQTGSASATNFIAFAAQYKAHGLDPITVRFLLWPNDTVCVLHNNQSVTFETSREEAEGTEMFSAPGVLLARNGSLVSASFDSTVTVSVTALSNILHASASLPEEYWDHTEGLLGVWNDNPEDDFRMPNGSSVPHSSSEETLFHYGMTWALNGTGLLGTRSDPLPSNFTPVFFSQLRANKSLASGCDGDAQCIYDTMATGDPHTGLHTRALFRAYQLMNTTLNQFPPSINGSHVIEAYKDQTSTFQWTSDSANITFKLQGTNTSFQHFENNGTLLWTPKSPEPVTLEILARDPRTGLLSVLQPKVVACFCNATSQCLYSETRRVGNSSLEEASCRCNSDTFGRHCERSKDPCDEPCFPKVQCTPGAGCGACPLNMAGDGRHCAAPVGLLTAAPSTALLCQNQSCPTNYCYNRGHCYISLVQGCQPACTCPPAFTDARCFLAGNAFVPSILEELPLRTIQLSLHEEESAEKEDVNASVAYKLGHLDVRAFLRNSRVERGQSTEALPSGRHSIQHWTVVSEFEYHPRGPVIHFLNNQLLNAVVSAFLPQARGVRQRRSTEARTNVTFQPISREDVLDIRAPLNSNNLSLYFKCDGYEGYRLVYSPENGVTCVSPCSEGYCRHGGQCQHLPDGPNCSCQSFSIYTSWGKRCEHLSLKLDAFFGILFGSLGALLLLGVVVWVALRLWGPARPKFSYPLRLEN
ncbi:PREDICTED: mucin-4 [Chinchilla lanigera]|uniref:mucin-4 n=1 Tax=Chinchilla lanigera TaxID=34839 RepID=UPI000698CBE7|nr:PREDICTED: mucin-4 [Chinchilla lanigera]